MTDENENGNGVTERGLADATVADLPHILRPLAERELITPALLLEAVMGFTLTGAMVSVKCDRRALAPRRLSHFAPDMLTRLAHELGAVGLVEVEISEGRSPTRGFAFFLDAETVEAIVPPAAEPAKTPEIEYPDGELGAAMRMMKMQTEALLSPIMAQIQLMQQSVNRALESQNAQTDRGMAMADMMAETQLARVKKVLMAETQTPEQMIESHLGAVDKLMTTAAKAEKAMAKYAPKTDPDAEGLGKVLDVLESPRAAAIGRGFLRMLGGNVGAPVEAATVTVEAQQASELPSLFSVPATESA